MKLLSKADLKIRWQCDASYLRAFMTDPDFPAAEPGTTMWDEEKIKVFEADNFDAYVEPVEHEVDLSFGGEVTRWQ